MCYAKQDMGTLQRTSDSEQVQLKSRCLIGRAASCDLRVNAPLVSSEHALVCWVGSGWELRDLGSKNGTFLGKQRLAAGGRSSLIAGDVVSLGGPDGEALVLVEAGPPSAYARHVASGAVRLAAQSLIVLPEESEPLVSVVGSRDGRWLLEDGGVAREVVDRETILVRGEPWVLELPEAGTATAEAGATTRSLENTTLRFVVSQNEEHVDLTVVCPDEEILLPPRGYHYLLATLARARLASASLPPAERGWLERDELCRMLATDELRLNVDVCRARKQFAALSIEGAANVVERRMGTGRIRIGVDRLDVRRQATLS